MKPAAKKHAGGRPPLPPDQRRKGMHVYFTPVVREAIVAEGLRRDPPLTKMANVVEALVRERLGLK